jgi:hypothetical protein
MQTNGQDVTRFMTSPASKCVGVPAAAVRSVQQQQSVDGVSFEAGYAASAPPAASSRRRHVLTLPGYSRMGRTQAAMYPEISDAANLLHVARKCGVLCFLDEFSLSIRLGRHIRTGSCVTQRLLK